MEASGCLVGGVPPRSRHLVDSTPVGRPTTRVASVGDIRRHHRGDDNETITDGGDRIIRNRRDGPYWGRSPSTRL